MRRARRIPCLFVAAALAFAAAGAAARAGDLVVALDPAATKVTFELSATLHNPEGRVPLTSGEIRFDPATGTASGRLVFDATKISTGNEGRDRKMHEEVLETATFPEFVFVPERVDGPFNNTGVSKLKLLGTLAIHGGTHPLSIPLDVTADGTTFNATGTLSIPYVAWGMKDPSVFLLRVAKAVDVTLEARGTIRPAP